MKKCFTEDDCKQIVSEIAQDVGVKSGAVISADAIINLVSRSIYTVLTQSHSNIAPESKDD